MRIDYLGASLAIFQTMFAIAAIYGFWALRGVTKERAEDVARETAEKVALEETRATVRQEMLSFRKIMSDSGSDLDPESVRDIMSALGKEETDDGRGT